MIREDSAGPSPTTLPATGRAEVSIAGFLTAFGLGVIVFASGRGKAAGAAMLALALVCVFRDSLVPRLLAAVRPAGRDDFAKRVIAALRGAAKHSERGLLGALALGAFAVAWSGRGEWPIEISIFLSGVGAALVVWMLVGRRLEHALAWRISNGMAGAMGVSAIGGLAYVVYRYAANIPFFDEFMATLPFVVYFPSIGWPDVLSQMVAPHYSHRIATTRLLALADLYLNGELNFLHLIWTSYALLLGAVLLIYRSLPAHVRAPALFAPFVLILFEPQYHQLTLWAFSIPHFSSLFFAAAAFALLYRGEWGIWAAMAGFIAATYSFATGIFVGFVGLVYLIDQRRYRHAVLWLVPLVFVVMRYFNGLDTGPAATAGRMLISLPDASITGKLDYLLEFVGSWVTLGYFTDFLGGKYNEVVHFPLAARLARAAGGVMLLAFGYVTLRRYWRRNLVVYGLMAITLLGGVMAADQRSATTATSPFLSRYAINSVLMLGLLHLALAELHSTWFRRAAPCVLAASALFCALSYRVTLPYSRDHAADLRYYMLQTSNGLYQGEIRHLPHPPLYAFHVIRLGVLGHAYSIPEAKVMEGLQVTPTVTGRGPYVERELPWRIVHVGENSVSYTFLVGPKEDAAPLAGVAEPQILLTPRSGESLAFPTIAFDKLPGHDYSLRNDGPPGADRVVCVPKRDLPDGRLALSLMVSAGAEMSIARTSLVLPTTWQAERSLTPLGLPELLHRNAHCLRSIDDPDGHCWVLASEGGTRVGLPAAFSVDVVVRPGGSPSRRPVLIWALTGTSEGPPSGVRLTLEGQFLVVARREMNVWKESVRLPVSMDTWTWSSVSFDDGITTLLSSAYDPVIGNLGPLQVAINDDDPQTLKNNAVLSIAAFADASGVRPVELHEIRIVDGALKPEDAAEHWPIFKLP